MADHLDVSGLTPVDAAAAARSYARRFLALLASPGGADRLADLGDEEDDDGWGPGSGSRSGREDEVAEPEELAHRAGADGLSALDHAVAATLTLDGANEALRAIARSPSGAEVVETSMGFPAQAGGATGESIDSVLATLQEAAEALAQTIGGYPAESWSYEATVGNQKHTALDVVRRAIASGADHLRSAESALAAARR